MHIFSTPTDSNYFFGYYDKSPISLDGTKHLALKVDFIDRLPDQNDIAKIGFFNIENNDGIFHEIAETKTFNWQQGCMLQWYGDKNNQIIYNDLINNRFVAIIFNLNTYQKQILPMAIYTLSSNSAFALCIDNERHHWCRRGYSYDGIHNITKNQNIVENDGIFFLDIRTETVSKIIGINDLLQNKPLDNMKDAVHYIEHLMIAPDNQRFAFFHRWKLADGGIYTRLYTANCDGSDIFLLNDSGRMSHFCWNQKNQIFGWGGIPNAINTLRKYKKIVKYFIKPLLPIYKRFIAGNAIDGTTKISTLVTGDSYIIFDDKTSKKTKISLELLNKDGHPSFSPINDDWIITDTYPDKNTIAQLILFHLPTQEKYLITEVQSLQQYDNTPNRCDLHPKWSLNGKYVSIDTMNDGIRGIYIYNLNEVISNATND